MDSDLRRLGQIAAMLKERELARLAELGRQRATRLRAVEDCRAARAAVLALAVPNAAHLAGMADPWLEANADRLRRLTADLARSAADCEEQGVRAQRAFGRAAALDRLAARRR